MSRHGRLMIGVAFVFILIILSAVAFEQDALKQAGFLDSEVESETAEAARSVGNDRNIIVGSNDGDLFVLKNNSDAKRIGSVKNNINNVNVHGNTLLVATAKNNTQSEDSGTTKGRIMSFKLPKARNGIIYGWNNRKSKFLGGQVLDVESFGGRVLTASHGHDTFTETKQGRTYEGRITLLNDSNLKETSSLSLPGASDLVAYDGFILAYGVGPKVLLLNGEDPKERYGFTINGTVGGADYHRGNIYLSSVREGKMRGVEDPPTVSRGYVSRHARDGAELDKINLGISSYPREIYAYSEDMALVNDYGEKEIKFVDFSEMEVRDSLELNGSPESMLRSKDKAYVLSTSKDLLYVINIEERKLERSINIPGIDAIAFY